MQHTSASHPPAEVCLLYHALCARVFPILHFVLYKVILEFVNPSAKEILIAKNRRKDFIERWMKDENI